MAGVQLDLGRKKAYSLLAERMPTRPSIPAKEVEGDTRTFTDFMRRLMGVTHDELKAKLEAEKSAKRTTRRASRASAAPSKAR